MVESNVNLIAAAFSSSPLWNFTPRRSLNCHVVGSTTFHDSASSPTQSRPSSDSRISVSNTLIVMLWVVVLLDCDGSKVSTSAFWDTIRSASRASAAAVRRRRPRSREAGRAAGAHGERAWQSPLRESRVPEAPGIEGREGKGWIGLGDGGG